MAVHTIKKERAQFINLFTHVIGKRHNLHTGITDIIGALRLDFGKVFTRFLQNIGHHPANHFADGFKNQVALLRLRHILAQLTDNTAQKGNFL